MVNIKNPHLNASARLPTMGTHGSDGMSSHGLAASIAAAADTFVDCWRNDEEDRINWFALDSTLRPLMAISILNHDFMTHHLSDLA